MILLEIFTSAKIYDQVKRGVFSSNMGASHWEGS